MQARSWPECSSGTANPQILEGTNEIMRVIIARTLLDRGRG